MKLVKVVLLVFLVLSFNQAFAEGPDESFMTAAEQWEAVQEISKNIRRSMWIEGYEDVSSAEHYVKKDFLDDYVKDMNFETNLDSDEVSQLYRCYHGKTCELYYVGVSSSMYGGWGEIGYFILFYPKSGRHFKISHVVYSE
jgi:hypothetical protein